MVAVRRYAHIVGWGRYVPEKVLTNDELSTMVDTSDEWIRARTGIIQRHIAGPKETTSSMALKAAKEALWVAHVEPPDLDLIIVATATPDYPFPATACLVQDSLGATKAGAFDLLAGCSGFVYSLALASQVIGNGACQNILVIGAETLSRIIDWKDRATCVLFGDGAGAFVLQASDRPGGILSFKLGSDGSGGDLLILPGGGSRHPSTVDSVTRGLHYVRMEGRAVFRFATRIMGKAAHEAVEAAGLNLKDIDLFIPHQANHRIIKSAARYLALPDEKVFVNVERYGNTSSASVPIAFCEAIEQERMKPGDHLVLVAFGAGLTWAAAVVQWEVPLPVPERPQWQVGLTWLHYRLAGLRSFLHRIYLRVDALLEWLMRLIQGRNNRR